MKNHPRFAPTPCPLWIVSSWTKHRCSQSPVGWVSSSSSLHGIVFERCSLLCHASFVGWLLFFCVRGLSLRHQWRGGLHRSPPDSRLLRNAWWTLSFQSLPSSSLPHRVLSWLIHFFQGHNKAICRRALTLCALFGGRYCFYDAVSLFVCVTDYGYIIISLRLTFSQSNRGSSSCTVRGVGWDRRPAVWARKPIISLAEWRSRREDMSRLLLHL